VLIVERLVGVGLVCGPSLLSARLHRSVREMLLPRSSDCHPLVAVNIQDVMITMDMLIPGLIERVDGQILWCVALEVWLRYIHCPCMESVRDVEIPIDMIEKVVQDHSVTNNRIIAVLHP
jgi:hypothetical protein